VRIRRLLAVTFIFVALFICIHSFTGCKNSKEVEAKTPPTSGEFNLGDVGFKTPESVLYDAEADVYLVSNINGSALEEDGNGFISRIQPGGKLLDLKWIDGSAEDVTLNAPKGMAITGDQLYVGDITVVRIFDRETGKPMGDIPIPNGTFVNDVTAAPHGGVFVTDTQTNSIFHLNPAGGVNEVISDEKLNNPNGLTATKDGLFMVPFGGNQVFRIGENGEVVVKAEAPSGGLDGLELANDGRLLFSSWEGSAVYSFGTDGAVSTLFDSLSAPADIGYDSKRNLVLIPLFKDDKVVAKDAG